MKRFAGWVAKQLFVCQMMCAPVPLPLAYPTKEAVVRPHKELTCTLDQYGPAVGPNSWIDYSDMNRVARKVFVDSQQIEPAGMNIVRWNVVGEVNDLGRGIRGKDYSLHCPNKIIVRAEVG